MSITRIQAQRCGPSHYQGCECQQWRYEQMEAALKIIQVWAEVHAKRKSLDTPSVQIGVLKSIMLDIAEKAKEALEAKR